MEPIISNETYNILKGLNSLALQKLFDKANVLDNEDDLSKAIRINSLVEIEDMDSKIRKVIQITLPSQANVKEYKISVNTPIGASLIGYQANMIVECLLPIGMKHFKIIKVENPSSLVK